MRLSAGDKLGPYLILEMIGKGGMGEVYRGTDTRLNRPVAIKVSSREFNDRFEREAHAISALNHPNICTLYDIGPDYLVMEFVEGDLLTKMIGSGQLPLDKAVAYGIQIVDALAAAHAKGIFHRDLKPGNIIITKNGVKVLDFGLAKLSSERLAGVPADQMDTPLTNAGAVLGTPYYMAPEQLEGKDTDERSDIFSFGIVFYEMITGQRPFTGDTQAAVLAAILKDPPAPMSQSKTGVPRSLERLVRKCLEKKPDDRWHSARDLKPALELIDLDAPTAGSGSNSGPTTAPVPVSEPSRKRWLWPAVAAVFFLAAVTATALYLTKPSAPARATRFQVTLPEGIQFNEAVSLSPDGHKLVFNATGSKGGLWIRDLEKLEWRKLPDTEDAFGPFWSPDSRFLAYGLKKELRKIDVSGGPPLTVCSSPFNVGAGSWSRDDVIIFDSLGGGVIRRVSAAGGIPADVTVLDNSRKEITHALPVFLPDGKHFLYLRAATAAANYGIYAGSLDARPTEQSRERILDTKLAARYADGNLFFVRDGNLMAQPFDAGKLQLHGNPAAVAEHVMFLHLNAFFSVSDAGVLAYRSDGANMTNLQTTWFDREGKVTGTFAQPGPDHGLALSPDAERASGRDADSFHDGDIWLLDFARGVRTKATFRRSRGTFPVWSPDGSRLAFAAGEALETIYEKAASGTGDEKELLRTPIYSEPTSWSHDGRFLLFTSHSPKAGFDVSLLPLDGNRKPVVLLGTDFDEKAGRFSPDMRWISYQSNESGRDEIYVRPFHPSGPNGPAFGEEKWQISRDGGTEAKWRGDGKELFFRAPNGSPMAVDVNGNGATLQAGVPRQLFAAPPNTDWDVTADGKRFLMAVLPGPQGGQVPITVVLNWQADLKK